MSKYKYSKLTVEERIALAKSTESADILEELAKDKSPRVRKAVAYSFATPFYTMEKLYRDDNSEVSKAAAFMSQFF